MGIARAIRRVKRQAKQGGINAVMSELGEGLRSRSVPAPLRGAARKLASLIDPTRTSSKARHSTPRGSSSSDYADVPIINARPPSEVTQTGVDSGAEPTEPVEGTPVDALRVGATPEYNATPIEVAPLEVAPIDATPVEVTPIEITPAEVVSSVASSDVDTVMAEPEAAEPEAAEPEPAVSNAAKKPAAKKPAKSKPAKEKLASDGGSATPVARSGSKNAKKRSGAQANTTSKKK